MGIPTWAPLPAQPIRHSSRPCESAVRIRFSWFRGYGAQGAGAADIAGAFDENGLGAIINSSRGIMCAWKKEQCAPEDFARAARREAIRMRDEILSVLNRG